ncbi:hypothetical protein FQA39_LY03159 [Lamprigera yunnana]|nr:hypothetical protein FQA39_LY03159 [Lamprigera yunnana]
MPFEIFLNCSKIKVAFVMCNMRKFYIFLCYINSVLFDLCVEYKMLILVTLSVLCILKILFYYFFTRPHKYWKNQGVPHEEPELFFGNLKPIVFRKTSMTEYLQSVYKKHQHSRYVGIHQFSKPALIIRDVKLINDIAVKEFETFSQHTLYTSESVDPIWAHNLFAMPGNQRWKDMRAILSPAFTTNKLRSIFYLMDKCAVSFTDYLLEKNGMVKLELKEAFSKVTNDIIASSVLGATCDSSRNPENEIFVNGREVCNLNKFPKCLKFFINNISPKLEKLIQVQFISENTKKFFENLIQISIKKRLEASIVRPDIINLLMEAKKDKIRLDPSTDMVTEFAAVSESKNTYMERSATIEITNDVITAQAMMFFLAGFDASSTAMSFAAYELALQPDVQERLFNEIDKVVTTLNGHVTYDHVIHMKYLDMVVSEVLRKWPPFAVTDRTAVQQHVIQPTQPNEKAVHINKNVICLFPIFALHRDDKYFPNPDSFDPERFSEQNKENFTSSAYMPFGKGRRNCIGSRFALLEVKIILIRILSRFEIVPIEETARSITLSKTIINPISDKGFWLGLKPRLRRDCLE